jgi:hypothetical protein
MALITKDQDQALTLAAQLAEQPSAGPAITGTVWVEARKTKGRVWVARYRQAPTIKFTRKVLAPAWVRESGKRTPRGAVVWRAAAGTKPDDHLTPKEADEALQRVIARSQLLAMMASRVPGELGLSTGPGRRGMKTFGDAVAEWLRYCECEKQLEKGTICRYENIARVHLLSEFGRDTHLIELVGSAWMSTGNQCSTTTFCRGTRCASATPR